MHASHFDCLVNMASGVADVEDVDMPVSMVSSGRSTLYCCLSCGMPFAFPDDAYTSNDKDVKEIVNFVHKIRHEIKKADDVKKSTMMWQACPTVMANVPTHLTITLTSHVFGSPTSRTTCTSICTPTSSCTYPPWIRITGKGLQPTSGPTPASPKLGYKRRNTYKHSTRTERRLPIPMIRCKQRHGA